MMRVEEKLRENLKAAADALVVPEPKTAPLPGRSATSRWRGPGFALAGAAAVLALALPALILWSGGGSSSESGTPATDPTTVVDSTDVPQATSATTTPPTTSTTTQSPDNGGTTVTLDELTINNHVLSLLATLADEEQIPTATVLLQVTPPGGAEPSDEIVVGTPAGFFWHPVTGEGAVCEFSADETDDGVEVTVQILLTPSIGCSEAYGFVLDSDDLSPDIETPEGVAQQFVVSWVAGDEETMSDLADPVALSQTREMSTPAEPQYSYCEGAAGSVYCTFEVVGGELVIRVQTEPPSRVIEVISYSD